MKEKIEEYYSKFKEIYTDKNYPEWFNFCNKNNEQYGIEGYKPGKSHHKLGHFAILQTPVFDNVSIIIVGNNNSWFVPGDMKKSLEVVRNLEKGIPEENFYTKSESDFAKDLNSYFVNNGSIAKNIFDNNTVGLNRLWIQTGPICPPSKCDLNDAIRCNPALKKEWGLLEKKCKQWTKEIIEILSPRLLLLLGGEARKLYPEVGYHKDFWVQHCYAPSYKRYKQRGFSSLSELSQFKEETIRIGLERAGLI
jgi:hypothetical protein